MKHPLFLLLFLEIVKGKRKMENNKIVKDGTKVAGNINDYLGRFSCVIHDFEGKTILKRCVVDIQKNLRNLF